MFIQVPYTHMHIDSRTVPTHMHSCTYTHTCTHTHVPTHKQSCTYTHSRARALSEHAYPLEAMLVLGDLKKCTTKMIVCALLKTGLR